MPRASPGAGTVPAGNEPHVAGEDRPPPVQDRSVGEKAFDASRQSGKDAAKTLERLLAGTLGREIARAALERAIERVVDDQPPIDHRRQSISQPGLAKLGKQQPHVLVCARQIAADVERAIERLFHQARHLRFVGHVEARIEIGFERKLAKQRQTKRIDGADGDVARPLAHVAPQLADRAWRFRSPPQLGENAAAHFGRGLAREGDGENVGGVDAAAQQIEVAIDEHVGLARARRRFEHDVVRGIDRPRPRRRIGQGVGPPARFARPRTAAS